MAPVDTLSFKCALVTGGGGGLVGDPIPARPDFFCGPHSQELLNGGGKAKTPREGEMVWAEQPVCAQASADFQGKAMASSLIKRHKKVFIAGRSEDKLRSTSAEIGAAGYYVLDTGDISSISSVLDRILADHPDLDCIINNAGVQRPFQVLGPDYGFDLSSADEEIDINIRGPMHLCIKLAQHWTKAGTAGVIMNVSSVLGLVPFSIINPCYNGTKAWLHMFTLNLRSQLKQADSPIRVVEIIPPSVETDLHRDRVDPDDNKKDNGANALSVQEFMDEVEKGWEGNADEIAPGPAGKAREAWQGSCGRLYADMAK